MTTIGIGLDFEEYGRRNRAGALRGAAAKKWMASQTTNVLAEARNPATTPARLDEIAQNATAACRIAVAGNPSTDPATLYFLSTVDLITSEISQRLTRNPNTPTPALRNIDGSTFRHWFGNGERLRSHPNWV